MIHSHMTLRSARIGEAMARGAGEADSELAA